MESSTCTNERESIVVADHSTAAGEDDFPQVLGCALVSSAMEHKQKMTEVAATISAEFDVGERDMRRGRVRLS